MVDIGKGIALQLAVLCFPQIRPKALTAQCAEPCAADPQHQCQPCTAYHHQPLMQNIVLIPVCDSDIHHVRHNQRNDQFEDTFRRDTDQADQGVFFVLLHIREEFFQHDCFPPWSDEFLRVQKMRLQYLHMQIL